MYVFRNGHGRKIKKYIETDDEALVWHGMFGVRDQHQRRKNVIKANIHMARQVVGRGVAFVGRRRVFFGGNHSDQVDGRKSVSQSRRG